jgi:hypothetical protein
MKTKQLFFVSLLIISFSVAKAQTPAPAGFAKGSITLADGSVIDGYVKDNIKKMASVVYVDNSGANKKTYAASQINAATVEATGYICISGDFFKTLSAGKMNFLQKASNASGNVSYNGSEAIFNNGTEGKIGDYFVYADNKLKLLNKKTLESFINTDLAVCAPAVEKAKAINGDIAKLQEAVEIYNKNR